jgi:hypothetical protein
LLKLLENFVIDVPGRFDFIYKPSVYVVDIDFIAALKESELLKKKKHRFKCISVKEREWVMVNEKANSCDVLPDETLYMSTKAFKEGRDFIYNKEHKYVLLPLKTAENNLLCIVQIYRSPARVITKNVRLLGSNFTLMKGELGLMQLFLVMVGSHLA